MPQNEVRTAAILAIGDELLSGRTRDANIHHLAGWLTERAIDLREARIVADDEAAIVSALNTLRLQYDYVFTSGGIGPTHDDITVDAIARAFGVEVEENTKALAILKTWYAARGEDITDARRRMARAPVGALLIQNPESGAPGVRIENVFVMAGVPRIFKAMLAAVDVDLERGVKIHSRAATAYGLQESLIALQLEEIQNALKGVSIGSYPIDGEEKGVTIVARSASEELVENTIKTVAAAIKALGIEPEMSDRR